MYISTQSSTITCLSPLETDSTVRLKTRAEFFHCLDRAHQGFSPALSIECGLPGIFYALFYGFLNSCSGCFENAFWTCWQQIVAGSGFRDSQYSNVQGLRFLTTRAQIPARGFSNLYSGRVLATACRRVRVVRYCS